MVFSIKKYLEIRDFLDIYSSNNKTTTISIIAVTKNHSSEVVKEAINSGITHFGENRVQEALSKFKDLKNMYSNLKLHLIGSLQTNKVKMALNIFDYIHSLDRESLAIELAKQKNINSKNIFIQINTGQEKQKSGIFPNLATEFINYCKNDKKLNVIGLMCLPPINDDPEHHFRIVQKLAQENNLEQLSLGMSSDYKEAIKYGATFVRIGTQLFGKRKQTK